MAVDVFVWLRRRFGMDSFGGPAQCFGLQQMVRLWWAVWLLCVEAAGWAARPTGGDGEAAHCAGGWETVQLHRSSDQSKSIMQSCS